VFTLGMQLPYGGLEADIQATVAVDLITGLAFDAAHHQLMRMHTNRPAEYVKGDTWPLLPSQWQHLVFDRGERLYCANPDQVLQGFRDGTDILALGYQAAVAFPITTPRMNGRPVAGVVNLLFRHRLVDAATGPIAWCDAVSERIDRFVADLPATT